MVQKEYFYYKTKCLVSCECSELWISAEFWKYFIEKWVCREGISYGFDLKAKKINYGEDLPIKNVIFNHLMMILTCRSLSTLIEILVQAGPALR